MVIQLTDGELALLELAALGRTSFKIVEGEPVDPDLALLLDMQLVLCSEGNLHITLMGQRVLSRGRRDPRRR